MRSKSSKARPVLYTLLFVLLFLCEYVFRPVYLWGLCPAYLVCGVVCLALYENVRYAAVFGLVFGILADFAGGGIFGLRSIVLLVAAYVVGYLVAGTWRASLLNGTIAVALTTVFCDVFVLLFYLLKFNTQVVSVPGALFRIILPKLLMTLVVNVLVYFVIKKIETNKKWRSYDEIYY